MHSGKPFLILLLLSCFNLLLQGNNDPVAIGNWRIHLPYHNVSSIAETPDRIYCAASHGIFAYNKADGTTERLSPINGFSGYKVQAMRYGESAGVLVIAYADGKIDLLKDRSIIMNDDIFQKTITGNKSIYHINIVDNIAYISTSFGLMELDIIKNEMRNSYQYIGANGSTIDVYSSAADNDSIYIATKQGILSGSRSELVNLYYFKNWHVSKPAVIASKSVATLSGKIYAEVDSRLFVREGLNWKLFRSYSGLDVRNIDAFHNTLIIAINEQEIIKVSENGDSSKVSVKGINQSLIDNKGQIWFSSSANGLVVKSASGDETNFYPNGPRAATSFSFVNAYNNLYVLAGGIKTTTYDPTFNQNKYYYFNNYDWTNSSENTISQNLYDYTVASYQKNGRLYIGTHGSGLLLMENGIPTKVYDSSNSPLKKRAGSYVYVTGVATDAKNNLWVSNWDVDPALYQLTPSGTWIPYQLPSDIKTGKILIDSRNNKWIQAPKSNSGMVVFTEKGTANTADDVTVSINTAKGTGNLPSTVVNDFAFTKSGELLVGTDQGYCKIRNPNNALTGTGSYDCERTIISVEANSNLGGYLLGTEIIYCITIDGADRRWFGTNNGAWLIDSDGETILKHFTTDNSPLMSNVVQSIGIMEATGEVFFGTEQGLVSYRSDALAAGKSFEKLKIFPNPVKPEFNGDIAITGMPDNTLVKITDINGSLVYQTFSNGGMATWNCRTFDGSRPSTGVYLAFCINQDGSETEVGKILFIR
jgi:ligand-binding sensor domain-containing protein